MAMSPTDLRENESRDNDFVRIPVEHETNDPVITEQPEPKTKETVIKANLKDLQALAIAAIGEASALLEKIKVSGFVAVIGDLALSLLGAKTTLDLNKIEVLVFLDAKKGMSVWPVMDALESIAGHLYVDQPTGLGKRLQVEVFVSQSRVVIDLIPITMTKLPEGEKFIWDNLDTKDGVKILSPGNLLFTTLIRWILAYDIVSVGRPSSVLWNKYAEETQNVLLLLKHLAMEQSKGTTIDASEMLRQYPEELMTFIADLYEHAMSAPTCARFGLEKSFASIDPQDILTKGIVGSIQSRHMLEGPGKEIEDFADLLAIADFARD
ncbi:hypothetical protein H0H92_009098 [Tricholoma furcatifolium]|nr:hypothetical protein H0H92_009098 [Tricholoma furcatifolium]